MPLANSNLVEVTPCHPEMLPDGRCLLVRRFKVPMGLATALKIQSQLFQAYGTTLDTTAFNGNTPPSWQAFAGFVTGTYITATMPLMKQILRHPQLIQGEDHPDGSTCILEQTYEEASNTTISASSTSPQYGVDQYETGPDAIQEITATFINLTTASFTPGVIGSDTHNGGILKEEKVEVTLSIRKVVRRYVVNGVFQARRIQKNNSGIMFVEFKSIGSKVIPTAQNTSGGNTMANTNALVGHTGGSTSIIVVEDRIVDIAGLNTFLTTIVLKYDGTVIAQTGATTVLSYLDNIEYNIPGTVTVNPNGDGSILYTLVPPTPRYPVKVTVAEIITDSNDVGNPPFYVKFWANLAGAYTTPDGNAHTFAKGLVSFLGDSSLTGSSITLLGQTCTNVAISAISTPTPTQFASDFPTAVLKSKLSLAFTSAYGKQYYRKRTVTVSVYPTPITY